MRNAGFITFFLFILASFGVILYKAVKSPQVAELKLAQISRPDVDVVPATDLEAEVKELTEPPDNRPLLKVALSVAPPRKIYEKGRFIGFDIGIMEEFADKLGFRLKFERCRLKDCLTWLSIGRSDMTTAIEKTSDRQKYLSFLNPKVAYNSFDSVYLRKNSRLSISSYVDLTRLKIGRLEHGPYIRGAKSEKSIKFINFKTDKNLFSALLKGDVDAVIGSNFITEYRLGQLGLANQIEKASYQVRNTLWVHYFVLSNKSQFYKDRNRMERVIAAMQLSGRIDSIIDKFYQGFRLQ